MSKKSLYLLGILLTILIGTYFYWKLCCSPDCCSNNNTNSIEKNIPDGSIPDANAKMATSNAFVLNDPDGGFAFSNNENFNFNVNNYSLITPISEGINGGIDQLKAYLEGNKNKALNITGWYTSTEENTSAFPNLGLARANAVKNYFVSKGMNATRMNLFSKINEDLVPDGTIYRGPVAFKIATAAAGSEKRDREEMEILKKKIMDDPLVLNFETGAASINLSTKQRQQFSEIARYLDKNPDGLTVITGHTDNTGSRNTNMRLGQERAEFAKSYLVRNGMDTAKIKTMSKGPDQPVANNKTEEGRAKNRRTVVTIN